MNYLGFLALLLWKFTMVVSSPFDGSWVLNEAFDESMQLVTLPEGSFAFKIEEQANDDSSIATVLSLNIKVGNSMRTQIKVKNYINDTTGAIEVGLMSSTMMMPPEELFKLETLLSNIMPKMSLIKVQGGQLVLEGTGKVVCVEQGQLD